MVRLAKVETLSPAPYTVLGWVVSDIEVTMGQMAAKGIQFERFEGLEQDAQGIRAFPKGDRVAWFWDPDGNLLSVAEEGRA